MKTLSLIVAAGLTCSVQAAELVTFKDVAEAVQQGRQLTFVTAFNACESDVTFPDVSFSIKPNAAAVIAGIKVTASDRHFTLNDPALPGIPAFGYSKFDIDTQGNASLKVTLMRAADYSKVDEFQVRCQLGKGMKVFG